MAQYGFPDLNLEQIIYSYSEFFELNLDEDSFKKPDPFKWQEIYQLILSGMTESPIEVYSVQAQFMTSQEPELHKDSVPLMHIALGMQRLLVPCGISDFGIRDLIFPSQRRLMRVASAVINFMKFKESQRVSYEEIKASLVQQREHQDTLIKRNESLKQQINQIKADRARQEPQVAQLQKSIDEMDMKMNEHGRDQASIKKSVQEIKTKMDEKRLAVDQIRANTTKMRLEADQLSQKIVQSPERVKDEQDSMKNRLNGLKEDLGRKRVRLDELRQRREKIPQHLGVIEKGQQLLDAIQDSVNKENEIDASITQITDRIQDKSEQLSQLSCKKTQVQHMLTSRQDKLAKMAIKYKSKRKVLQEQRDMIKQQLDECVDEQFTDKAKKDDIIEYRRKKEEELNDEQRLLSQREETVKDVYSRILENVDKFNNNVGESLRSSLNETEISLS